MSDASEIREALVNSYTKVRKNPFAEKMRKYGYTTRVYTSSDEYTETYISPEEVVEMARQAIEKIDAIEADGWQDLTPTQIQVFKKYRESNRERCL